MTGVLLGVALTLLVVAFYRIALLERRAKALEAALLIQSGCNKALISAMEAQGRQFIRREELQ